MSEMSEHSSAGQNDSTPETTLHARNSTYEKELAELKETLDAHVHPLVLRAAKKSQELLAHQVELASYKEKLRKTADEAEEEDLLVCIEKSQKLIEDLEVEMKSNDRMVARFRDKYQPRISELEFLIKDKQRDNVSPKSLKIYDEISKRLYDFAEMLTSKGLSMNLAKLSGEITEILHDPLYQGSLYPYFKPKVAPIPDENIDYFCEMLKHCFERIPVKWDDRPLKRSFLAMPLVLCALRGLGSEFSVDCDVAIDDPCSELKGKADMVIYCGKVEIIVVEGDYEKSAVLQAIVGMDCLWKHRLTLGHHLSGKFSYGIVTDLFRWMFLELDHNGSYSVSKCHYLDSRKNVECQKPEIRQICGLIRGMVDEAVKAN